MSKNPLGSNEKSLIEFNLTYCNHNIVGPEWQDNKKTWKDPRDTFSVPTGMFLTNEVCNDKPVTMSATILNGYGEVAPKRKNPTFIRAKGIIF